MVKTTETLGIEGLSSVAFEFCPSVLVVGDSLSAVRTSLALADRGLNVTVLGELKNGNAKAPLGLSGAMADFIESIETFGGDVPDEFLSGQTVKQLTDRFNACENIRFLPNATATRCTGQAGDFEVFIKITNNDDDAGEKSYEKIKVGAIVLAGDTFQPTSLCAEDFGLQPTTAVTNFPGLMLNLRKGYIPRSIAIVMDLAAEQGRLTSSMVFTTARYLAQRGCRRIRIYCQNTRVSSPGLDTIYTSARSAGVEFSRHDRKISLAETAAGLIEVSSTDCELGREITGEFDMLVFADSVYKTDDGRETSRDFETFGANPLPSQAGNIWLTPCETNRMGIFALGMDGANCDFQALRTEADLAAFEIGQLLAKPVQKVLDDAAVVDPEKCVACLTCLRLCPHGAIRFDEAEQAAEISKLACRRCGICVAECPANAITLPKFTDEQILAQAKDKKKVTVFACTNSAAVAAELARQQNFAKVQIIKVPCAGKVDPNNILKTFEQGAENVLVLGCNPEACKFFDGPTRANARLTRLQKLLEKVGFDPARLKYAALTANETDRFNELIGKSSQ